MSITRFAFCIWLATAFLVSGCSDTKPATNPLAGWQKVYNHDPEPSIVKDYQDYIHTLSPEEQKYATFDYYFENGTG